MASSRKYELTFFTATILEWKPLLANNAHKDIVIDSLRFLVSNRRITLNAFAIMDNHLHLIWHVIYPNKREDVQRDFLGYTAKAIIRLLKAYDMVAMHDHYVNAKDRKYQVWERNALSVDIWSEDVLKQKLDYIHNNPVKAGYCAYPEEYKYSTGGII
jgi:REP element-mobilizing transposase RayT